MKNSTQNVRSRALFLLASLIVLLPIAAGTFSRAAAQSRSEGEDSLYKHLSVFTEVLSLIQRSYVDETSVSRLFAGALEGTTNALDPLSTFVPKSQVEVYREAVEIGNAHSGLTVGRDDGISFVIGVAPGSPGALAGIESGDILTKIGKRSTREMPLWELQVLLSGTSKDLAVELLRRGENLVYNLELGPFESPGPLLRLERDVPVLVIPGFATETADQVARLLSEQDVTGAESMVIDLRGVAGGSVEAAYGVASLFVSGELGDLRSRGEVREEFTAAANPRWGGRLALLADGGSQGASEVLIAALKDSEQISVIGRRTFGHAGNRTSREMPGGASLFFTDGFYAGPDGQVLDQPIEPEIRVQERLLSLERRQEEEQDEVLERALEVLLSEGATDETATDAA